MAVMVTANSLEEILRGHIGSAAIKAAFSQSSTPCRPPVSLRRPIFHGEVWNTLKIDQISRQDRHIHGAGDGCNAEIHRAYANPLMPEVVEDIGRRIIERQDLSGREIPEYPLQSEITSNNSSCLLGLGNVGRPTEDWFVKRHDGDVEVGLSVLGYPAGEGRVVRIRRPLQDAQVVGVKDVQRYSLGVGAVGLSDLATEP